MDDDIIIEVTAEEFEQAYRQRLKELKLTEEELLRQAASGNFDTHDIRMLWMVVGSWKDGEPYIMV